ncbi:MAG: PspA/IM30 family protein [Acidobacteria bacterium]|nr:PspA/IM30 family protein [Acidobacteriota bacterium]MBI3427061.1 PspA/IM30 family protein [Acidobacteriota bacterium]
MWTRLKRLFRSIFGGIISDAENPELILQQLMRDMQDEVPKMRNNVAQVMAGEKRLAAEVERSQTQLVQLDAKVKAAIRTGNDDIATTLISQMQTAQRGLETTKMQHEQAKNASVKAREFLDNYMLQFERRKAEAMQLLAANRQAQMQEQVAQTMASFQMGDNSQTFDDMREKIANRVAGAEARAELASTGLDSRMQSIDREIANVEAQDMLLAYKQQMGLAPATPQAALGEGAPSVNMEKTLGAAEGVPQQRQKLTE